ncbi:hypothetical protein AB0M26_30780, partial [Streptomyces sp. NPDC051776]
MRLGLPQPGLQAVDLGAEVVGQGPGGVFLKVQGIEQGLGYLWAFAALRHSPGAGAHYRRRRETGDWHAA